MAGSITKILKWAICGLALIIIAEISLRFIGIKPAHDNHFVASPRGFSERDSILGWKSKTGKFALSKSNISTPFWVEIDKSGNRISASPDQDSIDEQRPDIHVYGCESTFGFSLPDSATCCYRLQEMLPEYRVINKAVMGYGLAQMYISLKESLKKGDTPRVAVFNYGYFQDIRTPEHKYWSSIIEYSVTEGYSQNFGKMPYPYFECSGDSLKLNHCSFEDLTKDWPYRDRSSIINLLNTGVDFLPIILLNKKRYLHLVSEKTAIEILQFCKLNHVIPIFANITPESKDIMQGLSEKGFYVLDYDIMAYNKKHAPNRYNCGVQDPDHPNALAHEIYAQKIYAFMKAQGLLINK